MTIQRLVRQPIAKDQAPLSVDQLRLDLEWIRGAIKKGIAILSVLLAILSGAAVAVDQLLEKQPEVTVQPAPVEIGLAPVSKHLESLHTEVAALLKCVEEQNESLIGQLRQFNGDLAQNNVVIQNGTKALQLQLSQIAETLKKQRAPIVYEYTTTNRRRNDD
jgi:hypothetical protein